LANKSGEQIRCTAGRKTNDQMNRPRRIFTRSMYVIMYIAQRPDSINVCGEINRVAAMTDGLLLLICAPVRNENLDIAEHST